LLPALPTPTLFPYTTLFRSIRRGERHACVEPRLGPAGRIRRELSEALERALGDGPCLEDRVQALTGHAGERSPVQDHAGVPDLRSEEHTSELQSLAYLVCRL